ncbi:chemotaxis protein CheA [Pseudotabrizicola alkalilacus]|uniref:Chemotaxis protein CheA n=1 Tax=Pseudotabrizicola alkalilacus TaxID=2305252 RepID=A0A411Z2G3_9RHOB|nr:chemotaxis protein CheA [Pseudotabrizicola alkalilacus]RGP37257.1 chemotaxis protein CheA [Pseudotabrizicola alkalilacus]
MAGPVDLKDIFFVEADELLSALEEGLRAIQTGAQEADTVNAVFRAVHSIKGGAGAFDLKALVGFAHRFETVLDALRAGQLQPEAALLGALLHASDHLADMISASRQGTNTDPELDERVIMALEAQAGGGGHKEEEAFVFEPLALDGPFGMEFSPMPLVSGRRSVMLTFRPHAGSFASGHDPALLMRDFCAEDEVEVDLDLSALPEAGNFDPGQSYLGWTVAMQTERSDKDLLAIFEFIEGSCDLTLVSDTSMAPAPSRDPPPPGGRSPATAPPPVAAPSVPASPKPPAVAPAAAVPPPPAGAASAAGPRPTIRVDIDRVDRLVDILGELVIHQAMLTEAIEQSPGFGSVEVDRSLDQLRQLSRQIQESVMAIRAQPVKPLFDRMHRIVREASMAAGKSARLVTEGEGTEVDKTIIERLADPLTHMIRNSVDHGLEKPARRDEIGKPNEGVIKLAAAHRSGRIVITVQDDGAGIDRDKVRLIAIEKGLISATAELSPQEIDALLFLPGFSTATEVSALSGRGVGMDVVRSEIAGLGGRVGIASVRGQGTTLTISLPLTLAVLDGMVFEAAGQTLVLPVSTIIETLRPEASMRHNLGQTDSVLDVRGRCLPLIDVGMALGFRRSLKPGEGEIVVVVERGDEGAIALMVDGIRDQRQVVIKGLEANYGQIPGIAAATVLGDGSVALILDPTDLAATGPIPARPVVSLAAE